MSPSKQQNNSLITESIRKPSSLSFSNSSANPNQDLDNLIPFNKKIQELENYSTIIENATSIMDECVKNMTEVYQSYDSNRFYIESPTREEITNSPKVSSSITLNDDNEKSLYDIEDKVDEKVENIFEKKIYNLTDSMHSDTLTSFDEKLKLDLKQEIK